MKRFRLSTLMLLIVIAALSLALVVQQSRMSRREAELRALFQARLLDQQRKDPWARLLDQQRKDPWESFLERYGEEWTNRAEAQRPPK